MIIISVFSFCNFSLRLSFFLVIGTIISNDFDFQKIFFQKYEIKNQKKILFKKKSFSSRHLTSQPNLSSTDNGKREIEIFFLVYFFSSKEIEGKFKWEHDQ